MNGIAEKLGQTLHYMANASFKDSGIAIQYWSELILTDNYLWNWKLIVIRNIICFEVDTERPPSLDHLHQIGQRKVA